MSFSCPVRLKVASPVAQTLLLMGTAAARTTVPCHVKKRYAKWYEMKHTKLLYCAALGRPRRPFLSPHHSIATEQTQALLNLPYGCNGWGTEWIGSLSSFPSCCCWRILVSCCSPGEGSNADQFRGIRAYNGALELGNYGALELGNYFHRSYPIPFYSIPFHSIPCPSLLRKRSKYNTAIPATHITAKTCCRATRYGMYGMYGMYGGHTFRYGYRKTTNVSERGILFVSPVSTVPSKGSNASGVRRGRQGHRIRAQEGRSGGTRSGCPASVPGAMAV